jgi:hypothetical protein
MNNQNSAKTNYIDLNDYDLPRYQKGGKQRKNCYHCPVCDGKLEIKPRNGEIFTCFSGGCARADIRKAVLALAGENISNSEWEAARAARAARSEEKLEAEKARIASLKNSDERHKDWLGIVGGSFLSGQHRQDMIDRGYTHDWIESCNARSTSRHGGGRVIPILDYQGRMVGGQVITKDGGKPWYGEAGTNHLKETGEIPLTVIYPQEYRQGTRKNKLTKQIENVGYIAYTESTGDKPWLCAHLHQYIAIGSSRIGSQPTDLDRSIKGIKKRLKWDDVNHVLMADAGSLDNNLVMSNYRKLNEQIKALGSELLVGWWGQYTKIIGDIDHITKQTPIKYITFDRFEQMGEDRKIYNQLSALSVEATTTINERYLPELTLKPNTISFVDSPCGTGKTEQLKPAIDKWLAQYPNAKIIDITHRNSIKSAHQKRLNIPEYRVGHGQNDAAINGQSRVSICLDSLLRLDLESISQNPALILDELEALLQHAAQGNTLGDKAANTQAHLVAIIDRVLACGGAVIGCEEKLTDISVKGLLNLTNNRYKYELIKNNYEPFNWEVAIGNGSNSDFIGYVIGRLKAGEKVFFPTSSQNYGEALEKIVLNYLPELADKIYRVDSKTSPDLQELFANPNKWLAERDVRLFIESSTIESGFDSSNQGQFNRVMARFANLDTRSHMQQLTRDRSDVPRDIFILNRGAELSNRRNPIKLLKSLQLVANQTSLATGNGRIHNNRIGDIWNQLDAQFSARAALCAAYAEDYLRAELAERGHKISPVNWQTDLGDLKDEFKDIRQQIKVHENRILYHADGTELTLHEANSVIHSSGIRFEVRQQATKTIVHHDLPGADLSEEFLMKVVTDWSLD